MAAATLLTLNDLPPEFENVYLSTESQSPAQSTVMTGPGLIPHDRRNRIAEEMCGYPGIGLIRTTFGGSATYPGVATLIAEGRCFITSAHNVVQYDPIVAEFKHATTVYFELRENKAVGGSALLKRYRVTDIVVYPPYYDNPTSYSGYDLALGMIQVPEGDNCVKELYSKYSEYMPRLLPGDYSTTKVAVVGFPAEHKGEKWGMVSDVPRDKIEDWKFKKDDQKEILVYDFMDTSPGQGGSPVMGMTSKDVIGVHTGGNRMKKWATYLNSKKIKWIAEKVGIKEEQL